MAIIPNLWFDKNAQEAVDFYTAVFPGGKILNTTHYLEAGYDIHGMEEGTVLTIDFEIGGQKFIAINAGPYFIPNPSISFVISCGSKEEVDALWEKLSDGGKPLMPLDAYPFSERYGWIQDKYGFSWQLILPQAEGEERPTVVPSLLFVGANYGKAEEAMKFYTSVFGNAKMGNIYRYGPDQAPDKEGAVMFGDCMLEGQWFAAMDSGLEHDFTFNEAISLLVPCETQEEIDRLWEKLSADPAAEQCGWTRDKYGVSWQIVPTMLDDMIRDPDKVKANRAMEAMLHMKKLDIAELRKAYEQG